MERSSPEFVAAAFELHRERGGGYMPVKDVEARMVERAARRVRVPPVAPRRAMPAPVAPVALRVAPVAPARPLPPPVRP